jgi:RNA-directed DNA polymerase
MTRSTEPAEEPAMYEQDWYDGSSGFRPSRSPHDALRELRERCRNEGIGGIVEAEVRGYVDSIDRTPLPEGIRQRVNEGRRRRLIGKWRRAGVREAGGRSYPESGVVQGGAISAM